MKFTHSIYFLGQSTLVVTIGRQKNTSYSLHMLRKANMLTMLTTFLLLSTYCRIFNYMVNDLLPNINVSYLEKLCNVTFLYHIIHLFDF